MTQEKTRLKFRVSALDGVSAGGLPEPRWSEKWAVGLFDYEEFHVTDQLLKLPFQEAQPKTVCVFSIVEGSLAFRMTDPDRNSEVNGASTRNALITTGDKVKIGESLVIEIALAPPKNRARAAGPGPSLVLAGGEIPRVDAEEGPTLTMSATGSRESPKPTGARTLDLQSELDALAAGKVPAKSSALPLPPMPGAVDPPPPARKPGTESLSMPVPASASSDAAAPAAPALKLSFRSSGPATLPMPSADAAPVFEERDLSIEIQEPSLNISRSAAAAAAVAKRKKEAEEAAAKLRKREAEALAGPLPGMIPEEKVELQSKSFRKGVVPPRPASVASPGPLPGMIPDEKVELREPKAKPKDGAKTVIPPRPASLGATPTPNFIEEEKVELADVPHAKRDRSLDDRAALLANGDEVDPYYAKDADLASRPTLAERLMASIARILRRDEVDPPEEPFPTEEADPTPSRKPRFEEDATRLAARSAQFGTYDGRIESDGASGSDRGADKAPFERMTRDAPDFEPTEDAGGSALGNFLSRFFLKPKAEAPSSEAETRIGIEREPTLETFYDGEGRPQAPKAPKKKIEWIPIAVSAAARLRGRALIFLLAAAGALMIAVGVLRIQSRISDLEDRKKPPVFEKTLSEFAPDRGIPIELIEDKVRRMRPPQPPRPYRANESTRR